MHLPQALKNLRGKTPSRHTMETTEHTPSTQPLVSGKATLRATSVIKNKHAQRSHQTSPTPEEKRVLRKVQSHPVHIVPLSDFREAEEAVDKAVSSRISLSFQIYENTAVMVAAVPGQDVQRVREIENLLADFGDEKHPRPYLEASSKDAGEGTCHVVQEVKIKHFDLHTVKKNSKHRVYEARRKHCHGKVDQGTVLQFSVHVGDGTNGDNWGLARWLDERAGAMCGTTNSLDMMRRRGTV